MTETETETRYKIVRMFEDRDNETIAVGLTLPEAVAHCSDPETSSSTATETAGVERTEKFGRWFDGFEEINPGAERERATWAFNLHWENDQAFYKAVFRVAAEEIKRRPDITDEALGRTVLSVVKSWGGGLAPRTLRELVKAMETDVGPLGRVYKAAVGERVRDALGVEA
jgi:hypothetical protein